MKRRLRRGLWWTLIWGSFGGAYLLLRAPTASIEHLPTFAAWAGAGAVAGWLLHVPAGWLRRALAGVLVTVLVVAGAQWWLGLRSFVGPATSIDTVGLSPHGPVTRLTGVVNAGRAWRAPEAGDRVRFEFQARARGEPGDNANAAWIATSGGVDVSGAPHGATRLTAREPPGATSHLRITRQPLAGRTFRIRLWARLGDPTGEASLLATVSDRHGYYKQDLQVRVDSEWERFSTTWEAPTEATSRALSITLSRLPRNEVFVRGLTVEELTQDGWSEVEGQPMLLSLPSPETTVAAAEEPFGLGSEWRTLAWPLEPWPTTWLHPVELRAIVGNGQVVEIRNLRLVGPGGPLPPYRPAHRSDLGLGHPNLAGHSVAILFAAWLTMVRSFPLAASGGVMSLATMGFVGSRAGALAIALAFALWVLTQTGSRRSRILASVAAALSACAAVVIAVEWLGRGGELMASRPQIWGAAWLALTEHPWTGHPGGFATFWSERFGQLGEVQHAHNLWLEFGATYGIAGLVSAFVLTVALAAVAWAWGRQLGMVLLAPLLLLQAFDYTLFYAGVLYPTIAALNALGPPISVGSGAIGQQPIADTLPDGVEMQSSRASYRGSRLERTRTMRWMKCRLLAKGQASP